MEGERRGGEGGRKGKGIREEEREEEGRGGERSASQSNILATALVLTLSKQF